MSSEKELKQRISDLEDEVRAARTTIKSLTKTLEQLSKNVGKGDVHIHRNDRYVHPYTYPYWWDGRTWYYQQPTYTLTSGGTDSTYTFTVNDDDDPDTGITVSNVS